MDKKYKHLEMIQKTISRLANNSFLLKGWTVTLLAGIFALSNKDAEKAYFLVAYVPIIVFWGLDAFYLYQERLYRALYDQVRSLDDSKIDFNLSTSAQELHNGKTNYWNCLLSKTVLGFYFPLALITAGIIIITHI